MSIIDCLFIGNNELKISEYEKLVKVFGVDSIPYRELNLNYIQYENNLLSAVDLFNELYYSDNNSYAKVDYSDIPNYTISYLGTYLNKRGLSFDYINTFQNEKNLLATKLKNHNIRTIVIICTFYTNRYPIHEIISFIKKHNTTAKIIIGGPYITSSINSLNHLQLQNFLKSIQADFYINSSQGEDTLANLIHSLKFNTPLSEIKNIYYKTETDFIGTPTQIEDNKLSDNLINWSLFSEGIKPFSLVRTSISCPFSCSFCTFPEYAGKYQTLDVESIESDLNNLHRIGVKYLHFIDDTLNIPPDRFKNILRMMIKNKYNFKWDSFFRCQFADEEMVQLMKESGCILVFLGIESGSQQILDVMNKKVTIEQYKRGLKLLHKYEILTTASFIIGFPEETLETYNETLKFIEDTQPTFYRANMWYCDKASPIYRKKSIYNLKGSDYNWSHSTMNSNIAFELAEKMRLTIKNSICMTIFNFDYMFILHLLQRGLTLDQIKEFLKLFNIGIREKLVNPLQKEVSPELIEKISNIF